MRLIACFTVLVFFNSNAQDNSLLWPSISKDNLNVLISIDSIDFDYHFYPKDTTCVQPNTGFKNWISQLTKEIRSDPTIHPDSIQVSISFEIDSIGKLVVSPSSTERNELEFALIEKISSLGSWNPKSVCNTVDIRINSKKLETYIIIEESASFPRGIKAFYKYLSKNLKYPETAQKLRIQGRVFVQFIVEKDGTISDAKVVKGIGGGCDEEALRVIKEMPKWIPGKHNGEAVRQKMIQNIFFKYNKSKSREKDRTRAN